MTVKEQLHRIVEQLPEEDARRMLDSMGRPNGGDIHEASSSLPIGQILEELGRDVPKAEWERIPSDLTDHLDGYLYGPRAE